MCTLLLGAGFSKWAMNLPIADELFDLQLEPWGQREAKKLADVACSWNSWRAQNPTSNVEQFIEYSASASGSTWESVNWYIVRKLVAPFIWQEFHAQKWRRHVLMIDERRVDRLGGMTKTRKFLNEVSWGLKGIVTLNYDMLVEYAYGTKGFNYGQVGQVLSGRGPYPVSQWRNPVILRGHIPLAKLHGSVSWDYGSYYTDGRRGLTGNALIVPPTHEKVLPTHPFLQNAWSLAEHVLQHSRRLLVFGISFNTYDTAVRDLLTRAGTNLDSVQLIDIVDRTDQARTLWPHANIQHRLPSELDESEVAN